MDLRCVNSLIFWPEIFLQRKKLGYKKPTTSVALPLKAIKTISGLRVVRGTGEQSGDNKIAQLRTGPAGCPARQKTFPQHFNPKFFQILYALMTLASHT